MEKKCYGCGYDYLNLPYVECDLCEAVLTGELGGQEEVTVCPECFEELGLDADD